jgi:hypothetical protein
MIMTLRNTALSAHTMHLFCEKSKLGYMVIGAFGTTVDNTIFLTTISLFFVFAYKFLTLMGIFQK